MARYSGDHFQWCPKYAPAAPLRLSIDSFPRQRETSRWLSSKISILMLSLNHLPFSKSGRLSRVSLFAPASRQAYLRVIAREQHVWNCAPFPYARARIVRIFKKPCLEALLGACFFFAHHAGQQPHAGI